MVANAAQAAERVGMLEAKIILSQAAVYLATAPKSNSAYMGIARAYEMVEKTGNLPPPKHLRMPIMPGQRSWATASAISIPMIFPIIGWSSSTYQMTLKMQGFTSPPMRGLRKS